MARKRNVPDSTKPPPIKERGKPEGIPLPQRADAAHRLESLRGRVVRLLRKICSEQELVEDAWCEGLTRMLNKFPNGSGNFLMTCALSTSFSVLLGTGSEIMSRRFVLHRFSLTSSTGSSIKVNIQTRTSHRSIIES